MYKVTFAHKGNLSKEYPLFIPGDPNYGLTAGKAVLEEGKIGEMELSVPISNSNRNAVVCLTDDIILYRSNKGVDREIFRGRVVTSQTDFYLTGRLSIEGQLSYLYDTYYPPFTFKGSPRSLLQQIINNHNSYVEDHKKFYLGTVTVKDNNDYISRENSSYERTLDVLNSRFIDDAIGGFFRARYEGGRRYLDYIEKYNTSATQPLKFGTNIIDLAEEIEYSDLITAVLPLGKMPESRKDANGKAVEQDDSDRINVSSVNGGDIYVRDAEMVSKYGFIAEQVTWDDVEQPSNLLTKARAYVKEHAVMVQKFTINLFDLAFIYPEVYDHFNLGDTVLLDSPPHNINQKIEFTKANLNLLAPEQDTWEFDDKKVRKASGIVAAATGAVSKTIQNAITKTVTNKISQNNTYIVERASDVVTGAVQDTIVTNIQAFNGPVTDAVLANLGAYDGVVANAVGGNINAFDNVVANTVQANLGVFQTVVADEVHANLGNFDQVVANTVTAHLGTFDDVVADTVTARLGDFEEVVADTVTARLGDFEDVVAETVTANLGTFENVVAEQVEANLGFFNDIVSDTITADIANFNSVITTALDTRYAAIDFANINIATMGSFFSRSGIIQDVVTENGTVTGELVGVTISGDLIEGNTIKAEKLVIRGTDGLYYQLNTNGETVESQQTDYNSINGSNIQAQSITASKIAVTDLYAFGATIAQFIIDQSSLHTLGKDSVDDPTAGIYMDSMGQFNTGDNRNYIVSYHDTVNDQWKIAIRADEITMGSGQDLVEVVTNAAQAVDDMQQRMDSGEFAGHTPVVTTSRSGNVTIMYVDGSEVARIADGENGATPNVTAEKQGDVTYIRVDGTTVATINDGVGVNSTTVTYGVSTSSETQPTTWSSTIPSVGEGEYLWTRTVTDYTDSGIPDTVEYTYTKQGVTGRAGTSVSVISIQYQEGTSATTAPTGTWSPSPVTVAEGNYLWTKTQFSDGNIAYSIAHQGKSGSNATAYWLIVSHAAVVKDASGNINPATISLTAKSQTGNAATASYSGRFKIETSTDNSTWTNAYTSSANESAKTYTIPSTTKYIRCSLYSAGGTTTLLDQQTVVVVSDGVDGQDGSAGAAGKDAYTVVLTNEAHTFPADNTKAVAGNLDVRVIAYKGTTQQNVTIGTISGQVTGMTTSIKNQGSTTAAFNVAVTNALTTQNGVLTIPVTVDGVSFTKTFSWALAKKGDQGVGISSITVTYGVSTSPSNQPTSWQSSVPTNVAEGSYLWTRTVTDYTDSNLTDTVTYTYSRQGVDGEEGEAGTSVGVKSIQYQSGTSATTAPTGTWSNSVVSVSAGNYLWTKTTFTDNSVAYSVSRQGVDGAASTTYSLILSNAAIVKNSSGVYSPTSITLTAKSQTGSGALSNYSGRFKIETSTDMSTWTAAYTSSSNEATKSYTVPANIKGIRCSLYLAGGTSTLLDQQTVPIVEDGGNFSFNIIRGTKDMLIGGGSWSSGTFRASSSTAGTTFNSVTVSDSPIPEITKALQLISSSSQTRPGYAQDGYPMKGHIGDTIVQSGWFKGTAGDVVVFQPFWTNASGEAESAGNIKYTLKTNNWEYAYAVSPAVQYDHASISIAYIYFEPQTVGNSLLILGEKEEWGNKPSAWSPEVSELNGTNGTNGTNGADAYTVVLSNESHTFNAGTSAAVAGSTECQVIAFKGATQVAATIGTISGHPTGMTTSISNNGSTTAKFTVSVTTSMTTKNGVLTVPITVDGKSFSKRFTYSLALKGDTGAQGPQGSKGDKGDKGDQGATAQWYYGTSLTHTSGTATLAASSTSGAVVGSMYLNTNTSLVYKCTAVGTNNTWTYAGNLTDGVSVGGRNLFGRYSDCGTRLDGMSQDSNKFTIVTEDGYSCAKAVGALQTTARLTSNLKFLPLPNEWVTFSCWVKISSIVRGTTNPMCELYLDGQYFDASVAGTSDRVWRSVRTWKTYVDGVYKGTSRGVDSYINDTKWHYVVCVAQYYDLPYNTQLGGSFYLRDATGTVWIRNIKLERGTSATDWSPAPEDFKADIATAQSTADTAKTNAATAQTTANNAATAASNALIRSKYGGNVKASAAIVAGNIIVGNSSGYHHLKTGGTFDISYPILYANSAISANSASSDVYDSINFTVTTTQSITLTAYKAVYIKGTLSGTTFTPSSTAPLTQTVPTSASNDWYILLGNATSTTAIQLAKEHPMYRYKNGAFRMIGGTADEAVLEWCASADYTKIDGGKLYAKSVTASKISVSDLSAFEATIGGFAIDSTSIHTKNVAITSNAQNSIGISSADFTRTINGTSRSGLRLAIGSNFGVSNTGAVYAGNAVISGSILATSGTIGGFVIESNSIHTNGVAVTSNASASVALSSSTFSRTIAGTSRTLKFAIGSNFGVAADGSIYAGTFRSSKNIGADYNGVALQRWDHIVNYNAACVTGSEMSSGNYTIPSGYRPTREIWAPCLINAGSGWRLGYLRVYTNGNLQIGYYGSYGSLTSLITQDDIRDNEVSSWQFVWNVTWFTNDTTYPTNVV